MQRLLFIVFFLSISRLIFAIEPDTAYADKINLDEVMIVGFKENQRNLSPVSASLLNSRFLNNNEIQSVKELSSLLPNFFMPDYGSKQNSPIYIRGIGTRINAPSVGFYVDGVPHFEKSAFDIDLNEISNIEVLRGPQGTLYGRNTIGGTINVYTRSPLDFQKSTAKLGYGAYNDLLFSASTYNKLSESFGFSASGKFHKNDGFFTNEYLNEKADKSNNASGRLGFVWKFAPLWSARLSASYDYTDQGGYPYGVYQADTKEVAPVNYDARGLYRRNLVTSGLNIQYMGKSFCFNSQSSFQYIDDKQGIDQDFTPKSSLYVIQKQKQKMFSQELTLKSAGDKRYEWIVGAFAFRQGVENTLRKDLFTKGYKEMKFYDIPTTGIAFYHQSTFHVTDRLSLSAGVRYDYEHATDDHSAYKQPFSSEVREPLQGFNSKLSFQQFTPKASVQYRTGSNQLLYATVSKGYKAGGFNTSFRTDDERTFDPEHNWNYEVGSKLSFFNGRLTTDLCLFYIDWRNQQIAQTVPGVGNIQRNANRSVSKGAEFSLQAKPLENFFVQLNYGYTHATFIDYLPNSKTDYSHNFLPMVPRHTVSLNAGYTFYQPLACIDRLAISGGVTGNGPLYWNEDNLVRQNFYCLLNMKVAASKGRFTWEVWGKNLTNTDYLSYYFVAGGSFAQKGKPITFGTSLIINL